MVDIIAQKFTKEDKREMSQAATDIIDLLTKRFGKGREGVPMKSQVMELLRRGYMDEISMQRIIDLDKSGNDRTKDYDDLIRIRQIVEGMADSHLNLMIFRDCDELWMQFHMSKILKLPTYVISEEKNRRVVQERIAAYVKKIVYIPKIDNANLDKAMKELRPLLEKEGVDEK